MGVPNIRFVFASVPNSGPNSVQLVTSTADFTQSVPAALAQTA